MGDDVTNSVSETIHHAIRLDDKIADLVDRRNEALRVAAGMAGPNGANMDYRTFYDLARTLKELNIPGRGVFTGGQALVPPAGTVIRKERGDRTPWPPPSPCVYLLMDDNRDVIYIGQSRDIANRMTGHRPKPWVVVDVIICSDHDDAVRLEGDLIYQHQPELNRAGRWERPRPTGADKCDHAQGDEEPPLLMPGYVEQFICDWVEGEKLIEDMDGDIAPLPPDAQLKRSLDAWIFGSDMTIQDLIDLIPLAMRRKGIALEDRWRYYCGIAWSRAREQS